MNALTQATIDTPRRQCGAALVTSLLFLLIMTVIGVTALQVATLEERMSSNLRNHNLAFQAAESALRAGELALFQALPADTNTPPAATSTFGCTNATCPALSDVSADSAVWSGANTVTYAGTLANLAASPQYLIEVLTPDGVDHPSGFYVPGAPRNGDNSDCIYRITARGVGGTSNTVVILQSTFKWFYFQAVGGGICHA